MRLVVEADGGSRGNPGQAAYGALVRDATTGEILLERAETIGVATNNVAEYSGLVAGLAAAKELDPEAVVEARMDSKLVVEQMSGRWQIKHPDMRALARQAREVFPPGRVTYVWVPRSENSHADRLLNAVLDGRTLDQVDPPQASRTPPSAVRGWGPDVGSATTLSLLRHGVTEHTVARRFSGSGGADPALAEVGVAQARLATRELRTRGEIAAVVTSPLRRALETAEHVASGLGVTAEVDDGWRECAFGEWDGLTYAEVAQRWPAELAAWHASPDVAPPGGESLKTVAARVDEARARLVERLGGAHVVVVSHVTPIKTTVAAVLEAPLSSLYRMELSPASLTTAQWWPDGGTSLRHFNDISYLD